MTRNNGEFLLYYTWYYCFRHNMTKSHRQNIDLYSMSNVVFFVCKKKNNCGKTQSIQISCLSNDYSLHKGVKGGMASWNTAKIIWDSEASGPRESTTWNCYTSKSLSWLEVRTQYKFQTTNAFQKHHNIKNTIAISWWFKPWSLSMHATSNGDNVYALLCETLHWSFHFLLVNSIFSLSWTWRPTCRAQICAGSKGVWRTTGARWMLSLLLPSFLK